MDRAVISPGEAAELLGVSRQTIYNLAERGQLTRYKVGRCVRLHRREVLALVGVVDPDDAA